jgi:hypothetical protein
MAKLRRITPSLKRQPALVASRVTVNRDKLCYILVADKKLTYPKGRSAIIYIGTTKNGINRVAGSVAERADNILKRHGITSFTARVVTSPPRRRVRTWLRLEGSLLTAFKEKFGALPKCNDKNGNPDWERFSKSKINRILEDLS